MSVRDSLGRGFWMPVPSRKPSKATKVWALKYKIEGSLRCASSRNRPLFWLGQLIYPRPGQCLLTAELVGMGVNGCCFDGSVSSWDWSPRWLANRLRCNNTLKREPVFKDNKFVRDLFVNRKKRVEGNFAKVAWVIVTLV